MLVPKSHAEHMAYEQTVGRWLAFNPPLAGEAGSCLHCGSRAEPGAILTTCQSGIAGLIHHECRDEWGKGRRAQAVAALAEFGISQ